MTDLTFAGEPWFTFGLLPLLIFLSRLADVSLDTMRIIFLNRGNKIVAPLLGFVQVTIWLVAISQVMSNLTNPLCYFAYSAGFAAGNFVGLLIEERVAAGFLTLRIITPESVTHLCTELRGLGHGVTTLVGQGAAGPVNLLFVVLRRKHLSQAVGLVKAHAPQAFYSTEEIRTTSGGTVALAPRRWRPTP